MAIRLYAYEQESHVCVAEQESHIGFKSLPKAVSSRFMAGKLSNYLAGHV